MRNDILWETRQVARKEYLCDLCFEHILPGEEYRRFVVATVRNLCAVREHTSYPLGCEWRAYTEDEEEIPIQVSVRYAIRDVLVVAKSVDGKDVVTTQTQIVPVAVTEGEDNFGGHCSDYDLDEPF